MKSLLDSLVHAGLVEDDSLFDEIHLVRREIRKPGQLLVTITPFSQPQQGNA